MKIRVKDGITNYTTEDDYEIEKKTANRIKESGRKHSMEYMERF